MPVELWKDNVHEYVQELRKAGIALQEAAADAVNSAAWSMYGQYRLKLLRGTLMRNKEFTLKSIRVLEAHAKRSSGKELRKIEDINAKLVVMPFASGKTHYLALLEFGATKTGTPLTNGRVPVPLDSARGGNRNSPVKHYYQLQKGFSVKGTIDLSKFEGHWRQQYAIMSSMNRRGAFYTINKQKKVSHHGYYYVNYGGGKMYMFKVAPKKVTMIRDLSMDRTTVKPEPYMEETVNEFSKADMNEMFIDAAKRKLAGYEYKT